MKSKSTLRPFMLAVGIALGLFIVSKFTIDLSHGLLSTAGQYFQEFMSIKK